MGVIKEGTVSGIIPSKEAFFAVHYPGYPSSTSRAIQTLGGTQSILKARTASPQSTTNKLELYFRPEDPYSHPITADLRSSNALLLKISKTSQSSPQTKNQPQLHADIVARVPEAYHFEGMADYQHVVPVQAETARRKKRNWSETVEEEEPHFEKAGLMDLDHEGAMILLPPLFSPKDVPENVALRLPSTLSSKKKQDEAVQNHIEMNIEPSLAIDFNIKEIPKKINWKEYITQGSKLWEWQMAVSEMFEERPIWPKDSVAAHLVDKGFKYNFQTLKRLLLTVAYYFSGGPFLRFWIRKGYDPRRDPDSCKYQRIDFRVPPPLRSYCDANAANRLKHRWEELCKFRVFPYKCHTSLQLYELDDEYIQQEIKKPSKQTTCTYGTGWFSQHVHDSIRHRVMVRFLSVYPEAGAEKLLKAASEDFAKSKRACIYNDAMEPDQDEQQQINRGAVHDETNENPNKVDDGQADEVESDDGEEELDAYEELDLAGEDGEVSLQSHSYTENNSRSFVLELLGSFGVDTGDKIQDADSSDGEYQIYEQDNDEYDPDGDDD